MKKITLPLLVLFGFALACTSTPTVPPGAVETEVARQLTLQAGGASPQPQGDTPKAQTTTAPAADASPTATLTSTVTPTDTLTPTPTETSTPSITPSFTPPSDDPRTTLGAPSWKDTFADDSHWTLFDDGNIRMLVTGHQLEVTGLRDKFYDEWTLSGYKLENFYLEMTYTFNNCSTKDRVGFIFDVPDTMYSTGFLLQFSCDGRYILRYVDNSKFTDKFFNWPASPSIYSGANQTNRLGVKVVGDYASIFANGHFVADLTDVRFAKGRFGPAFGGENSGYQVRVAEIAFWNLP